MKFSTTRGIVNCLNRTSHGREIVCKLYEAGGFRGLFDLASSEYNNSDVVTKRQIIEAMAKYLECDIDRIVNAYRKSYRSRRYILDVLPDTLTQLFGQTVV